MTSSVQMVIMAGGEESCPEEILMAEAWRAATLDWIDRACKTPVIGRILVATNSASFADRVRAVHPSVETTVDSAPFHFGGRLREIIVSQHLTKPFYAGAGSGVLLTADEIESLAQSIRDGEDRLIANNFYSSDFIAFTPGEAILRIDPPDTDNDLAWRLGRQAGLQSLALPPSAASLFDLDTPVDLMIALAHPDCPARLRTYLEQIRLDSTPILRTLDVLRKPGSRVTVAGRVGAAARAYLEDHTGCKVTALAEERGMRASGRAERGEARTILGHFMRERGPGEMLRALAANADLVLMDSRVLFSHLGQWPSNADRYRSDMLQPEGIADPALRQLTEAVARAPIPVVLGGHSLVSGGLYALVDMARSTNPR
jgi:hypothetical protein